MRDNDDMERSPIRDHFRMRLGAISLSATIAWQTWRAWIAFLLMYVASMLCIGWTVDLQLVTAKSHMGLPYPKSAGRRRLRSEKAQAYWATTPVALIPCLWCFASHGGASVMESYQG